MKVCVIKHNESSKNITKEYKTWLAMHRRCRDVKDEHRFKYYGSRGIVVCERWGIYDNFLNDMGRAPTEKHTIDRIDNNGNYEPSNCKWSDKHEQNKNRRNSLLITHDGKTLILKEWADELKMSYKRLHALMKYKGKTFIQAIEYIKSTT